MMRMSLSLAWIYVITGWAAPAFSAEPDSTPKVVAPDEQPTEDPVRRLAELRLDAYLVPARMISLPLPGRTKTIQEVLENFEKWSDESEIGAILLDIDHLGLSMPDVEELRAGVKRLRDSGKKVFAFLNGGSPNSYLLASAADEVVMAPTGSLFLPGIGRLFPYMKGFYQMRGVEFEVITAGRYKYPGFLNEREPNAFFKEEMSTILDSWFEDYQSTIAESRKLSPGAVSEIIDTAIFNANDALNRGLVDSLAYFEDYRDRILQRDKMKQHKELDKGLAGVNSIQDLMELLNRELQKVDEARRAVGPKIAVLHARGPIIDADPGSAFSSALISRDPFGEVVDELRKNKSIKAVVMHVDSPGGSGYASDVIWQKLRALAEVKPLVVSMGSVAGSGGYYIACPAHRIFAHPTTITGSIGVLSILQSSWSMFNRMDYEITEMKRGARSLFGAPHRNISKEDRAFLQDFMDDFYGVFIDRVASTRKLPAAEVRKIAEGRIYTGRQALEIGLIDELGGLPEAIESARTMANIPASAELKIVHYPRPSSLGEFFESFSAVSAEQVMQMMLQASSAAGTISFDQQVALFASQPQVLCWMAMPDIQTPHPMTVPSVPALLLQTPQPGPFDPLGTFNR